MRSCEQQPFAFARRGFTRRKKSRTTLPSGIFWRPSMCALICSFLALRFYYAVPFRSGLVVLRRSGPFWVCKRTARLSCPKNLSAVHFFFFPDFLLFLPPQAIESPLSRHRKTTGPKAGGFGVWLFRGLARPALCTQAWDTQFRRNYRFHDTIDFSRNAGN